ncbi:hypothetical protein RIF29_12320 [Crotalaria pallida]|uniref:ENT domain-containing protein n=1 Tax=Crotalaria pallida TaxID=3830 RepID=A0AAN9P208_CROPI
MTNEAGVERVPRKAIRPCPPLIEGIERWAANDVLEVYDDGSWTAGKVLKFIGRDLYLVMLFVSCKELEVHKVNMRVRQSWQNGEWVVKPKVPGNSGNFEGGKCYRNSISNGYKVMPEVHHVSTESQQGSHDLLPGLDGSGLLEPRLASSTTLKRVSPYGSSPVEAYPRKIRVVMNKGECERFKAVSTAPLMEKVDAVAYPLNDMGEKCMHTSFTNGTNQYNVTRKENHSNLTTHFLERIEEPDYSCSHLSSVGSCSVVSDNTNKFSSDMLAGPPCQDGDALSSDAESLDITRDRGCLNSPREVIAERIHRLELHAYRSTLELMYASSHLSWEQEELLTNLRISLNVSNDEHSMELKKLVSAGQHF